MFLRILIACSFIFSYSWSVAQHMWCYTDSLKEISGKERYDAFFKTVHEQEKYPQIHTRSVVYFQVVVHVVRTQSDRFISKAQVVQQIDILNNDFAGKGENIHILPDEFRVLLADTEIKFCLATVDPDGNPTDGITYTLTDIPDIALAVGQGGRHAIHYDELHGKTGWDPARYINIWVGEFSNFLGSSFLPGMAPHPEEAGVVISNRAFGSLSDAAANGFYGGGHTLTHEMGHYFGLLHIWGHDDNDCSDSDDIDDTPNAAGPHFNCPSGGVISCETNNMYQNFMDLTDDRCLAAFTIDQAARMHASIDAFYTDMAIEGPCHPSLQPFDQWYDQLIWAYDQSSGKYVIYHPDGFADKINIEVYSADGRMIMQTVWNDDQSFLLDLSVVPQGIYFVRITDGVNKKIRKVAHY
jgi:hypothetical protein